MFISILHGAYKFVFNLSLDTHKNKFWQTLKTKSLWFFLFVNYRISFSFLFLLLNEGYHNFKWNYKKLSQIKKYRASHMILYHKKLCTMYMHAHCKTITYLLVALKVRHQFSFNYVITYLSSFAWQQGGNKVLGGLGNIIFPPIFIASLLVTVSL